MSVLASKPVVRDLSGDCEISNHALNRDDLPPALFLSETPVEIGTRSSFFARMSAEEFCVLRDIGREIHVPAGETVFFQGERHEGIFLIEFGSVRTFYVGPSGREITLAYWTRGNFVGGPEIFGGGEHIWSGVAAE
ncbi:MAG: Crp/Fnr family transcriptional regulator, partial [Proteobacteria bacterium]|nr:Crp/Fnr family transcriptional regulator [Pseudomonadota bacterium]